MTDVAAAVAPVQVRAYLSPTLVLLALDWPEGKARQDFLGFAIRRTPGFRDPTTRVQNANDWLPNRLTFNGPIPAGKPDAPSNVQPIQKFLWWDARFGPEPGGKVEYEVFPVCGTTAAPQVLDSGVGKALVTLPDHVVDGIGTWFNRAVLSSQAFSRKVGAMGVDKANPPTAEQQLTLWTWLANGMETVIPSFLGSVDAAASVVYHLTDEVWVIPAWKVFAGKHHNQPGAGAIVYDAKEDVDPADQADGDSLGVNQPARQALEPLGISFYPRTHTSIMHDKYIVGGAAGGPPTRLLCGSANFTTEGLTSQANLLHTFDSPELAQRYHKRADLLRGDPSRADTRDASDGWSSYFKVGSTAYVRSIFSPEPTKSNVEIQTIVDTIKNASSVYFCLFDPTDATLLGACIAAADRGASMLGLANNIAAPRAGSGGVKSGTAQVDLYAREHDDWDVVGAARFGGSQGAPPMGFEPELSTFPSPHKPKTAVPGQKQKYVPNVIIHHKFIVVNGETDDPIVFSGSANMSANSVHMNDENLLEIRSQAVAGIYLAEFMRLFEHYRARAQFDAFQEAAAKGAPIDEFKLAPDASWAHKDFADGSPQSKARVAMSRPQPPWNPKVNE